VEGRATQRRGDVSCRVDDEIDQCFSHDRDHGPQSGRSSRRSMIPERVTTRGRVTRRGQMRQTGQVTDTARTTGGSGPGAATDYQLSDRYHREDGRIFMSGLQAIARLPVDQLRIDRRNGLNTAAFVSGYQGSPVGAFGEE